jgi:hypothetical protein
MLVRLNQIDPRSAEGAAGWTTGGLRGSVAHAWPASTFAYQLQTLDTDEGGSPVPDDARRREVRRLTSAVVAAVARADDRIVVRVDGPFGPGLMPAVAAAGSADTAGYSVSAAQRLTGDVDPILASVRLATTVAGLDELAGDDRLALSAGVRLRAFPLPADLIDPMLDTADPDDERWRELLPRAAGVVSTAADLLSIVIWTAVVGPDALRDRLATRLATPAVAATASA